MSMTFKSAGFSVDGTGIIICEYRLEKGLELVVTNLGAAVVGIRLPDNSTNRDITLGFFSEEDRLKRGPMFGATLGRYAGKILGAQYEQDGERVLLSKSHGEHHAHGGIRGFDKHAFYTQCLQSDSVTFGYESPDGEEGYPGNFHLEVTYRLADEKTVNIEYRMHCDKDTPACVSNHIYYNLLGNGVGFTDGHIVRIRAEKFATLDENGLPSGGVADVKGTLLDFRTPVILKDASVKMARYGGIDHDFILDDSENIPAVMIESPQNGRTLAISTDMPCIHFYSADFGDMQYHGKDGAVYSGRCGLCFEPMYVNDSLHNRCFSSSILKAGTERFSKTTLRFGWRAI